MRENGPLDKIRVSESKDEGLTWGPVGAHRPAQPRLAGSTRVRLANGHWVLIYNDTTKGRNSLAVSLSEDEGKTWSRSRGTWKSTTRARYHYPADHPGRRRHDPRRLQLLRRRRQEHEARRLQRRLDHRGR